MGDISTTLGGRVETGKCRFGTMCSTILLSDSVSDGITIDEVPKTTLLCYYHYHWSSSWLMFHVTTLGFLLTTGLLASGCALHFFSGFFYTKEWNFEY